MKVWAEEKATGGKRKCAGRFERRLFWLILVPIFAWCGRDGLRGQTTINPNQIRTAQPATRELIWSEIIATQLADGTYLVPVPVAPPGTTQSIVTLGPTLFRNNGRQNQGTDYTISATDPARFMPVSPWSRFDTVLVEYWAVINGGPTQAAPGITLFGNQPVFTRSATPAPTITSKPAGSTLGRFLTRQYPNK